MSQHPEVGREPCYDSDWCYKGSRHEEGGTLMAKFCVTVAGGSFEVEAEDESEARDIVCDTMLEMDIEEEVEDAD